MTELESRIAALSPEKRAMLEAQVAGLATARAAARTDPIKPRDRSRPTPLSFAQQREWALERFRPSNNISSALRLEGDVDLELLSRVLTEVTARHEVLRTTVEIADRTPVQVVQAVTPVPVPVIDLSDLAPAQQRVEVRRQFDAEIMRPFPPEQAQRIRATALRLGPTTYIGLLTVHHSSTDGWSAAIILREMATLYRALHDGKDANLPPMPIQYGDFAAWQRQRFGEEWMATEMEYWREVLADLPPRLALPTDRPYPAHRTFAGAHHSASLSREVTAALERLAEDEGVSVSMIMLAIASVVLHRYTQQDDLVFGVAITGRVRPEAEPLIGCFANALPLRMKVSPAQTLLQVLRQARDVASAAFDHQDIPFDKLIDELVPRETSKTPLIQMMINVATTPGEILRLSDQTLDVPGMRITPEPVDPGPVPIDLILGVQALTDSVHLNWHYSTELFDAETVIRLAAQFEQVVHQLIAYPDRRIDATELISVRPQATPSATVRPSDASTCFVEVFQRQAALAPEAPAVICDGTATTFGDLNREANRLARHLRSLGVTPETPVGILLNGSPQLALAVLGVLKAGGAYLPMDPGYPADRIGLMLADAAAPVLITTADLAALAEGTGVQHTVLLDSLDALPTACGDLPDIPEPTWPAYVVYTSGSTGRPKGVVIEHGSLAVFAREVAARLQLGAGDRFLQFASPSFDVLAEELFPVWLAGGAVVFPPPRMAGPRMDLAAVAERERVTLVELPAAYWHEWVRQLNAGRHLPGSLRLVIVGAERVLPERLVMWQKLGVPLMHVYGITETTVSSTFFRLGSSAPAGDLQHLPIGTALPSADLRIMDAALRPVPAGAVGELYIGGVSLARGYLGHPALTAERFVADPDPAHAGTRVYRTGDLVRQRADGNMEFVSRADTQIKIRGYRVEPAEIESAIGRHPQVAESVVTVHEHAPGDRRLVAYLVPAPRTRPNITDLHRFLARELPPYLVPAAFVTLDRLPVTLNGKIDHDRLPLPSDEHRPRADGELVLPRTPLEAELAHIVASVLGVTLVGANDNFFELGGDSILAIQVAAQAQEKGISLAPLDLFQHPTVALLAQASAEAQTAADGERLVDATPAEGAGPTGDPGPTAHEDPTPSEFPLARADQADLDTLLRRITDQQA